MPGAWLERWGKEYRGQLSETLQDE
jgi:hypothetical protein